LDSKHRKKCHSFNEVSIVQWPLCRVLHSGQLPPFEATVQISRERTFTIVTLIRSDVYLTVSSGGCFRAHLAGPHGPENIRDPLRGARPCVHALEVGAQGGARGVMR